MRKFAASVLTIMAVVTLASPAVAEPTWGPTTCWAGTPYNSEVKTQMGPSGFGPLFHYRNAFTAGTFDKPLFGNALWYYLNAGQTCGRFGMLYHYGLAGNPATGAVHYYYWYFLTPGNCDARYIITLAQRNSQGSWSATGHTYEGAVAGAFCG